MKRIPSGVNEEVGRLRVRATRLLTREVKSVEKTRQEAVCFIGDMEVKKEDFYRLFGLIELL